MEGFNEGVIATGISNSTCPQPGLDLPPNPPFSSLSFPPPHPSGISGQVLQSSWIPLVPVAPRLILPQEALAAAMLFSVALPTF